MASESIASRRNLLTGAIAGVAGFAAGAVSASAMVSSKKGPQVMVDGRARFKNKVILITGATSGIGAVAAKMFAAEGGKVAFCGRRTDRGAQVESEIKTGGGERNTSAPTSASRTMCDAWSIQRCSSTGASTFVSTMQDHD